VVFVGYVGVTAAGIREWTGKMFGFGFGKVEEEDGEPAWKGGALLLSRISDYPRWTNLLSNRYPQIIFLALTLKDEGP
jgi:hypothetical protein